MTSLGIRRVLLNHSAQSRWITRAVYKLRGNTHHSIDAGTNFCIRNGNHVIPVYRLYKDIGTSGKQRASGAFIAMERV